jgi:hypothetical protein
MARTVPLARRDSRITSSKGLTGQDSTRVRGPVASQRVRNGNRLWPEPQIREGPVLAECDLGGLPGWY